MSDDQLENWIIQREREQEVRSRIIPASADRLTSENPGDGEAAMEAVGSWLGDYPQLPLVEIGRISPRAVTLTFSEETILPEPWASALGDSHTAHDQWGIALHDALELPRSKQYGWQVDGLTGIGTLVDGSRGLINTCRWEILQIAGSREWTQNVILTQIMNQAAEPWSKNHDLWLVGFGETADKLMNFLAHEHPVHRFHVATNLKELQIEDLQDITGTIYVLGADRDTELQFQALQTSGVGLIADNIITDQAMFLTERENGQAVLGPFRHNLEVWPNLSPELIEKMEQAWLATEEIAKQKAAETDFDAFLTQQENTDDSNEVPESEHGPLDEDHAHQSQTTAQASSGTQIDEGNLTETAKDAQGQVNASQEVGSERSQAESNQADDNHERPVTLPEQGQDIALQVFGQPRVATPKGDLTGRHAALVVILKVAQEPVPAQEISEALWPGDEATGHNARTRRSRLRAKVNQHLGEEIVQMEDEGWVLQENSLTSDYDILLNTINDTPITETDTLVPACQGIERPLKVAETWAEPYRATMTAELIKALGRLKDSAVEAEEYDTAKAAKKALRQLGEA